MNRFIGFILFAEMRTGSNFLQESLNRYPGLTCHGEAFNPSFVGQEGCETLLGIHKSRRDSDPDALLGRIVGQKGGIGGFRFFHDHDPRILERVLSDKRIAKVFLNRDPLETYVSWKIATETGQWKLTDPRHRRRAKVRFDAPEFDAMRQRHGAFRRKIRRQLVLSGQVAFEIDYSEVGDPEVLNGLAAFLGSTERPSGRAPRLVRQNPEPLEQKVANHGEMMAWLAASGDAPPAPEPPQGAALPTFVATPHSPLLFMPLKGGPEGSIRHWMAAMERTESAGLLTGFDDRALRRWKNRNKRSVSFTLVRHPVERAFSVFERYLLIPGPKRFDTVRQRLEADLGIALPEHAAVGGAGLDVLHKGFLGFLSLVRSNLSGCSDLRTDPAWSSQAVLVEALSAALAPDMILRSDRIAIGLMQLCQQIGRTTMPTFELLAEDRHPALADIYDQEIEAAARSAYGRDYMAFGFRNWRA